MRFRSALLLPRLILLSFFLFGCQSDLDRAGDCIRIGDPGRARDLYRNILDRRPLSFEARFGYALSLQKIAENRREVGEDGVADWQEVVKAYEVAGRIDSTEAFRRGCQTALYQLAAKLQDLGRSAEALDMAARLLQLAPSDPAALNFKGLVQYSLGDLRAAEDLFAASIRADSSFTGAYLNLGELCWNSGRREDAVGVWERALARDPGDETLTARITEALE